MRASRTAQSLALRGSVMVAAAAAVGAMLTVVGQVIPDAVPASAATVTLTMSITCTTGGRSGIASALAGDGPVLCAHEDQAPAGVDVGRPVATAALQQRDGAADEAAAAATAAGVVSATAVSKGVECDGDGTSGYRVQAMYVVEKGKTNRYAQVAGNIRTWAAGVDDVVNRSAALTGGSRHVRFVTTELADGTCVPSVLNVTVPAGANADLAHSTKALAALGYGRADRRYLSWTDANVYCGIGYMYADSSPGQGNANNGANPSYARVDSACWGMSNSVEAHELTHTLGAVQPDAPHATAAGHCTDDADRMCYVDGAGVRLTQTCPAAMEALLDCGSDDYFSTSAKSGTYLANHWNAADNRFLIGGGDGVRGGTPGAETRPVLTVTANTMVPGLPTQVSASARATTGRRIASIVFTPSARSCAVAARKATSPNATVTCPATATRASVTVTATDDRGAKATASTAFTVDVTPRPVDVSVTVNGRAYAATSTCAVVGTIGTRVRDAATGTAVSGLPVGFRRTAPGSVDLGSAVTAADGRAGIVTAFSAATYTAASKPGGAFAATAADAVLSVATCRPTLTAVPAARTVRAKARITVTGTLRATPAADGTGNGGSTAGGTVAAAGEKVVVSVTVRGAKAPTVLGTATVRANGAWTLTAVPTVSGPVTASYAGTSRLTAASASAGTVTLRK